MKECKTCKRNKELSEYGNNKYSKDGLNYVCNSCRAEYELQRRIAKGIKPKVKPVVQEEHKECLWCHVIKHKDEFTKNTRGRLGKAAYCKICEPLYQGKRKSNDVERVRKMHREYTQKYRDKHREKWRAMHRVNQFNYKNNIKLTEDGTVTEQFMKDLYDTELCCWCNKSIPRELRTAEHIKPLHLGGKHSAENLKMACLSCNSSKINFKK